MEKAGGKTWRKFKCFLCSKKIRNEINLWVGGSKLYYDFKMYIYIYFFFFKEKKAIKQLQMKVMLQRITSIQ